MANFFPSFLLFSSQSARVASAAMVPVCLLLTFLGGCARPAAAPPPKADSQIVPRGFSSRTFVDGKNRRWPYVLFIPYDYQPGHKYPVLLFFNGYAENGSDGMKQICNNFGVQIWERQESFPFIVVAPQCRDEGQWVSRSSDTQAALTILDQTIAEFGADSDRVILTGVSAGGSGVWDIGSTYPRKFAGIVPLCGGSGSDSISLVETSMPIWNFYNRGDAKILVDFNLRTHSRLLELGLSPRWNEYPQHSHDCWNRAYRHPGLVDWMLKQRRPQGRTHRPFTLLSPQALVASWESVGDGDWTAAEEGLRPPSGERTSAAAFLSNHAASAVELHADLKLMPGEQAALAVMPPDGGKLTVVTLVLPDDGTGSVAQGERDWLVNLDPVAQRSLQAEQWNDVRLTLRQGRLQIELNGYPACDVIVAPMESSQHFRVGFASDPHQAAGHWQRVRIRHD